MKILLCVVSYVLFLSASFTLQAQPANDNFASRIVISGGQLSVNGTTVGATREGGEPNPYTFQAATGPSVWYDWTASSPSSVTMALTGTYRVVLGAYTGTAVNALTQVAVNSAPNGGTTTAITFTPVAGTSYKILVSGRGATTSGTFTLSVTQAVSVTITAPANNTSVAIGTPVVIDVSAIVPNPPVARVDFYRGGSLIGTDTTSPYSFTNTPAAGNNSYIAVAAVKVFARP